MEPEKLDSFLHLTAKIIEVTGVSVIVLGVAFATILFVVRYLKTKEFEGLYTQYRQNVGRGILLGLEFLVAADIIGTVLISPGHF